MLCEKCRFGVWEDGFEGAGAWRCGNPRSDRYGEPPYRFPVSDCPYFKPKRGA